MHAADTDDFEFASFLLRKKKSHYRVNVVSVHISVCIMVSEWHLSLQQPQEEQLLEQREEQFPAGGTADFQPHAVWNRCTSASCRFSLWCSWKSHMYTTADWTTCWMCVFTLLWIWLFSSQKWCCKHSEKISMKNTLLLWRGSHWKNTDWLCQTRNTSFMSEWDHRAHLITELRSGRWVPKRLPQRPEENVVVLEYKDSNV